MALILCRPKSLPLDKLVAAAKRSVEINPENAAEQRSVVRTPPGRRGGQRRIAVVVGRKWPRTGARLSVSFMDNPSRSLRSRILEHMNAWGKAASVVFSETQGIGEVRIARLDSPPDLAGYWSYIGTEILEIPADEPTLNLEGFTMRVSDAEFRRVVRHEAGHTLGFEHEHMRSDVVQRIDRAKAIAYFDRVEGWSVEEVKQQVLTPLAKKSIMGTAESDPVSIMCYHLPGSIMKDGKAVPGGSDINERDYAFAASLYPGERSAPKAGRCSRRHAPCRKQRGGSRHLSHRHHGRVSTRGCRPAQSGQAKPEVRAGVRHLRRCTGHHDDALACGHRRGRHALRGDHPRPRTHQGVHQPRGGIAADRRTNDRFRQQALRDALSGRCAAPLRRSARTPATAKARPRADLDDSLDRREAVGVRVRRRATELSRDRRDPLRAQRADQRAGRPRGSGGGTACASWSLRRSRWVSTGCRSSRKSRSSAAASSR